MDVFDLVAKITLDRSEYDKGIEESGSKFSRFGQALKKGLGTAAKIGGAAVAAFSTAAVAIGKQAISSYAEYEQLTGGIDTLFKRNELTLEEFAATTGRSVGEAVGEYQRMNHAANTVMKNAENAYKTAGMSANEYMRTVTSFSASLLQSLGGDTEKAARYADVAVTDMADNANKMGTNIESIQAAYQGFAKQNYTMLDNLSLGYGGTKTEMERLILDAEKLDSSFKATRNTNGELSMSYADIVDAIHIVQTDMDITGTTAREASQTISGSIDSAKAAWSNLLVGFADDNADLTGLINNFVDSVVTAGNNLIPRIETVLGSLVQLITTAATTLVPMVVDVLIANLPLLIQGGTELIVALINGIVLALPQLVAAIPEIVSAIGTTLEENWPAIKEAGTALLEMLWQGIEAAVGWLLSSLQTVWENIKSDMSDYWNGIKDSTAQIWDNITTAVSDKVDSIKTAIANGLTAAKDKVSSIFNTIKEKITTTIESARDKVRTAIDKIKGFFNFSWSLPKLKLPHFSVGNGPEVLGIRLPKINIEWYRKAYDQPYAFDRPTVMGFGDGSGAEMVYGRDNLMRDIREAVGSVQSAAPVINIYPQKGQSEEEIARKVEQVLVRWDRQRKAAGFA